MVAGLGPVKIRLLSDIFTCTWALKKSGAAGAALEISVSSFYNHCLLLVFLATSQFHPVSTFNMHHKHR
jgi:hypothetical protein